MVAVKRLGREASRLGRCLHSEPPDELQSVVERVQAEVHPIAAGAEGCHLDLAAQQSCELLGNPLYRNLLIGVQHGPRAAALTGLPRARPPRALLELAH